MPRHLDALAVADQIGIPLQRWPGNCYGISCAVARAGIVVGAVRYGHFLGEVSPDCTRFRHDQPFQRHGWIDLADNVSVCDPTRWVFEAVEPYVYIGPKGKDYDVGGNQWREAMLREPPSYDPAADRANIEVWKFCPTAHRYVMDVLLEGAPGITMDMAFWLGALPLQAFKQHAEAVYRAFLDAGQAAMVPIDNMHFVLPETAPAP